MTHAEVILKELDDRLNAPVELTLYGRAALQLGFDSPLPEHAMSHDVDAVFWLGQAEMLSRDTNFWDAVDTVNQHLADQELYISHFFTEEQVILGPDWRQHRVSISGNWRRLTLYRLGDLDLLLSKLMRNDPLDQADARFIAQRCGFGRNLVERAIRTARVPAAPEIREHFELASRKLLSVLQ